MKKKTKKIKQRIFKYNLWTIILLTVLIAVEFNFTVRDYFERDFFSQIGQFESNIEATAFIEELQIRLNLILLVILIISALFVAFISSQIAKKISAPFSSLNKHIRSIAERNFGSKIHMPVDDELQELVNNINRLSERLESYDNAQKTFLQNASHEFRTPLMSIQSYAEGIKYEVVDAGNAADIIIAETKRLTRLVEDLLYLSRLEAIEETYRFEHLDLNEFMLGCLERVHRIAVKKCINITFNNLNEKIILYADEEKLSRAIMNIISNCLRYATTSITIQSRVTDHNQLELVIMDDGHGFEPDEVPHLFGRFYRGKQGNFGLGLAISNSVIEKHNGKISANNADSGAMFVIELPHKSQ